MPDAAPRPALSIVVPVYNEEGNVVPLHDELTAVATRLGRPWELLFVNDGSRDETLPRLRALTAQNPHLRVVDLDGNFGEASALCAGFSVARGEVVVTLDGDGQNDPHDIPKLLAKLDEGYDVASGRRLHREEGFFLRVLPSWVANRLIVLATRVPAYDCGCGLKAYRRRWLEGVQLPRGFNRFLPAILGVDGTRVAEIETRDRPRGSGQSHYGFSRVLVVLRDLPSLPFLCRRRPAGRTTASFAGVGAALLSVGAAFAAFRLRLAPAVLAAFGAAVATAVRHNVLRFVQAREAGVFRIRRVLDGSSAAEHRDRGRGVLGQEPAPHLPQAAFGTGRRGL
ncbi:MAG: glycosyltransferase family 2 protein [bacterium]|nr:glycosyltransferase family 2 protein [bacterium]